MTTQGVGRVQARADRSPAGEALDVHNIGHIARHGVTPLEVGQVHWMAAGDRPGGG